MTSLPVLKAADVAPLDEQADLARELTGAVEGDVRVGLHDRMLYSTDASIYQVEPLAVVVPASIDDAVAAVEFCSRHGLPILPRGGGTSLAGQCTNRAVVIDFAPNCRSLIELDVEAHRCRVEPGITVDDLNDRLAQDGLFFAPDPATARHANIGGCIGNNSAGARSIRFGRTSESILAIDACLADGARVRLEPGASEGRVSELTDRVVEVVRDHADLIRERFPKTVRRNAGYNLDLILQQLDRGPDHVNLASLLCGSEGTLALTLSADLALHPLPVARGLAVLAFATLDDAIEAVLPILETQPTAVELLDDTVINLAAANAEYRRYVELLPGAGERVPAAVLYVEYSVESSADELKTRFEALSRTVPGVATETHTDATAMAQAWKLRKAGEPLLHGVPGTRKPLTFVEDNAVPVENLSEFVREFRRIVSEEGTTAAFFAHASVGVLHVRPLLDATDPADLERLQRIAVDVADLARSLGGVMSGEHGDGRVRSPLLERYYGPELMQAFSQIKRIFDPRDLLNPGNIIGREPISTITRRTRTNPIDQIKAVPDTDTWFKFDDHHGFSGAVELCNGAGVCRKKQGGTMCPSYMATLDERHSTRGRGNALRLAITGQLGDATWTDEQTRATLDLCLSCKACKTECPSNVDIARLKAEYTAQGFRVAGTPLKARAFGHVRTLNRMGSMLPGLANAVAASGVGRAAASRLLGISPRRTIPRFARSLMRDIPAMARTDRPVVALFGDCFTVYNEPRIGRATRDVLEALGYEVIMPRAGCCGRSLISTGLLDDAVSTIDATVARLVPLIDRVRAIVVCEPSCLSAIRDDWLDLRLSSDPAVRARLADTCMLVEDFVERASEEHPGDLRFDSPAGRVILHGHCHQKALWGIETTSKLLSRIAGDNLTVLDTGCCGMAGSFGYAAHRYDLSMRIGELALFPAVRNAESTDVVVAPGTSCRHQIADGTGRSTVHPIEYVASVLRT